MGIQGNHGGQHTVVARAGGAVFQTKPTENDTEDSVSKQLDTLKESEAALTKELRALERVLLGMWVRTFPLSKEEGSLAHSKLNNTFDMENAHELSRLLSEPEPVTVVPAISARRQFLRGERLMIERKFDDGTPLTGGKLRDRETLPSWNRLDNEQKDAIGWTDGYPLSIIEGPPGTGKTRTIATFLACRTNINKSERIMVCAPRNVAVQQLVATIAAFMRSDGLHNDKHPISPLPLVHLETEGVIDASYLNGKPPQVDYHLHDLRIRRARHRFPLPPDSDSAAKVNEWLKIIEHQYCTKIDQSDLDIPFQGCPMEVGRQELFIAQVIKKSEGITVFLRRNNRSSRMKMITPAPRRELANFMSQGYIGKSTRDAP
ncbi:hypothetical protein JMJ35_005929 [Cladonia borealis]|uniref:DNA2/NAM7 helicase helicase domain-containing protein n=1 Tax=Cladonia borealis TaxID=184061 RepID=A0AA39R0V2_9LECA|nr:hypothetical protein JMJ35_005929 [Cladonia borealis]